MRNKPTSVLYPMMSAINEEDRFFVCRRNGSQEIVVHSEPTADRAQQAVDVMNEQQERNDQYFRFYWRVKTQGDANVLRRDRIKEYPTRVSQSYGFAR